MPVPTVIEVLHRFHLFDDMSAKSKCDSSEARAYGRRVNFVVKDVLEIDKIEVDRQKLHDGKVNGIEVGNDLEDTLIAGHV